MTGVPGSAPTESVQLVQECQAALLGFQQALTELYAALGVDPHAPQDLALRFKINRNLTIRLSRVLGTAEPFVILNHLPSQHGLQLVIDSFQKAGISESILGPFQSAVDSLQRIISENAGTRDQLELMLESMGLFEQESSTASGHELAFRGNSMVWGVQARTRITCTFFAPAPSNPGHQDAFIMHGLVGFQRLRSTVRWRIYRAQLHDDKGKAIDQANRVEEFEEKKPGDTPLLIREFCSPNMPELQAVNTHDGRDFYLPGGQVGKRSVFDCFFGYGYRNLPARRNANNQIGSTAASLTIPAEQLIFDLVFHRDLGAPPEANLYGFPNGGPEDPTGQSSSNHLPLLEKPLLLPGSPPVIATPAVPQLARVYNRLFERMNWNASEFRAYRLIVKYPPMSSRIVMSWPLPE